MKTEKMLPVCLLDVVYDYELQLKVSAVNEELKKKVSRFRDMVVDHYIERWQEWVQYDHTRAAFPEIYGPEGNYGFKIEEYKWWHY